MMIPDEIKKLIEEKKARNVVLLKTIQTLQSELVAVIDKFLTTNEDDEAVISSALLNAMIDYMVAAHLTNKVPFDVFKQNLQDTVNNFSSHGERRYFQAIQHLPTTSKEQDDDFKDQSVFLMTVLKKLADSQKKQPSQQEVDQKELDAALGIKKTRARKSAKA